MIKFITGIFLFVNILLFTSCSHSKKEGEVGTSFTATKKYQTIVSTKDTTTIVEAIKVNEEKGEKTIAKVFEN